MVAPHLGASTAEAQDKAGVTIAEQVFLALAGDFVPFAVNVSATEVSETVRPFMGLAEQLGRSWPASTTGCPTWLEIEYQGGLAGDGTGILTLSVLKGSSPGRPRSRCPMSTPRSWPTSGASRSGRPRRVTAHDYVNLITLRGGGHAVAGTLTGPRAEPRMVMVDDHTVEVPPAPHMLVVRNDDRPGMIGVVGTILGDAGVSISSMAVGPSANGNTALMVLTTDGQIPDGALASLREAPGISDVHTVRT